MSNKLHERLVRYKDLVPSKMPFVESKLAGHRDRSVYSIIGPGVTENLKGVSIAEAHGFNIGGVDTAPNNGSSLHSHTTAEVFLIHKGPWKFFWGVEGNDGEIILNTGDVVSFPLNMFRGFKNVGHERSLMYTILGRDDPGVITWSPNTLNKAKETGMVLLNDNTIVDTTIDSIPSDKKILEPLDKNEIKTFDKYFLSDIEKCVVRFDDLKKEGNINNQNGHYFSLIETFEINGKNFSPKILHKDLGFNLGAVFGKQISVDDYILKTHEVFMPLSGEWKIYCDDEEIIIKPTDIFSVPMNSKRRFKKLNSDEGLMYIVREKTD